MIPYFSGAPVGLQKYHSLAVLQHKSISNYSIKGTLVNLVKNMESKRITENQ